MTKELHGLEKRLESFIVKEVEGVVGRLGVFQDDVSLGNLQVMNREVEMATKAVEEKYAMIVETLFASSRTLTHGRSQAQEASRSRWLTG